MMPTSPIKRWVIGSLPMFALAAAACSNGTPESSSATQASAAAACQTVLTPSSGGSITDADGNVWTLTASGEVDENGAAVPGGGGTSALTYVAATQTIWGQDAGSGGWYSWVGSWDGPSGTDPRSGPICGSGSGSGGGGCGSSGSGSGGGSGSSSGGGSGSSSGGGSGSSSGGSSSGTTPGTRNWYENPGQDGTFWVQPFQTTATWDTDTAEANQLRNGSNGGPSGHVHLKGDYSVPWVIGYATDPLVTVTDGNHSIQVHVPAGTVVEEPTSPGDQSIGGADVTQPYLVWSISGASIDTGSVQDGSVISGSYGFDIDDGSGQIMMDAVTGQPGTNNSIGNIQDFELAKANADPNYVIQHMLAYELDPSQVTSSGSGPCWSSTTASPTRAS